MRKLLAPHECQRGDRSRLPLGFRDWAAETTRFPHEVAELALAHTVGSAVERAYRRSDLLELRRQLMEAWGEFCTAERGKVLAFQGDSVSERLPSHPQ